MKKKIALFLLALMLIVPLSAGVVGAYLWLDQNTEVFK